MHALHWPEHVIVLRVCCHRQSSFGTLVGKRGFRFSVDDFVVNRFFTEVASCVSVRFSLLLELEAPGVIVVSVGSLASLRLALASLWCLYSRFHELLVLQGETHEGQVREGCLMSSTVVSVVF